KEVEREEKDKQEREKRKQKKEKKAIEKAKETGEKQVIESYTIPCRDKDEECNWDKVYIYVDGNGEKSKEITHTW
ncbi:MAG: hypothetical protein ACOC5T_08375, partial [Elusimicrobiota bacterium]